jgi:hypothetical protein
MGSGTKKKSWEVDMGDYLYTEKENEAFKWCISNNIKVYPKPKSQTEWYLIVNVNGVERQSPEAYKKTEIWKNLFKFYTYYYDKYKK